YVALYKYQGYYDHFTPNWMPAARVGIYLNISTVFGLQFFSCLVLHSWQVYPKCIENPSAREAAWIPRSRSGQSDVKTLDTVATAKSADCQQCAGSPQGC